MLLIGGRAIAKHCGITQAAIYRWIAREGFPAIKLENQWAVSTESIELWMKAYRTVKRRKVSEKRKRASKPLTAKRKERMEAIRLATDLMRAKRWQTFSEAVEARLQLEKKLRLSWPPSPEDLSGAS